MNESGAAGPWARDVMIDAIRAVDVDAVAEIERRSYAAPWGREIFVEELAREVSRIDVLRERGRVIAFCNYWLVHDEIHLLNIAVDPERRGRGHARRLLGHLIAVGEAGDYRVITLEVRRSNARALDLYRRHGFREVGCRRAYYGDGEDASVMIRHLGAAEGVS